MNPDISGVVIDVIAETFGVSASEIARNTVAEDIDGWDSLAHTMLMIRLEKRLGVRVPERVATMARDVGALIDLMADIMGSRRPPP
ncbi:hypothetical protein STAQ_48670 [Allostella sp. ATCC 35155]|nr:hypothetical protein STAQ_48670 [Stella sp. ATCC 35155]